MLLSVQQAYELLARRAVFAREICDKCGVVLDAVRYTRRGDLRVWCSRQCRDGIKALEPGKYRKCRAKLPEGKRRGAVFCDDACRKTFRRQKDAVQTPATLELSRTKPPIYAAFSLEKRQGRVSGHPGAFEGLKR